MGGGGGASLGTDAVCLVAAVFHGCIWVQSMVCVRLSLDAGGAVGAGLGALRAMAATVAVAYTWDLFSIKALGVVPLSRCRAPGDDIVGHHVPVLLVLLPLGLPFALASSYEPACQIAGFHRLVLFAEGVGFLSSLNEAIMCLQRVRGARALFRSRPAVFFELLYKVLIFSVMALGILVACAAIDCGVLADATARHPRSRAAAALAALRSPVLLRSLVYGWFVASKYPLMGRRAWRKLAAHVRCGDGAPPLDWDDVPESSPGRKAA